MSKWRFKRDIAFRKLFFVPDSFSHPAKMDAQLLIKIVETYTEAGETILDPMAGSGTTMLACTLGRNCILVELEEKFCKMIRANWELVKMRPQLGSTMGSCQIIQGDARQLEGLLVDKCVFSPPYAESQQIADTSFVTEMRKQHGAHWGMKSNEQRVNPDNPNNISNLPYGQIDKIDSIITSPPYEEAMGKKHHSPRADKLAQEKSNPVTYTDRVDSIITSPPYEASVSQGEGPGATTIRRKNAKASSQPNYSEAPNNIGNLKSQSYLEAMLQVYQQCLSVLKDGGLMILVTKNFIRNKQVIRLDKDTIKLCEQSGFSFVERHERVLPSQSFWRVIYHQRHPEVEQIKSEDILVFKKDEL